jgi:hypothetical protein
MLGHKTAIWYAWEHRERRGRGGGHKEEGRGREEGKGSMR